MSPPHDNAPTPGGVVEAGADQGHQGSLSSRVDHSDDGVVETLATVLVEMRPNLPPAVAASMVVEALDRAACLTLDARWAAAREAAYPAALRAAHARHSLLSFTRRRAQQLDDIKPREGDYPGRWDLSPYWRERFDKARDTPLCPDTCQSCWVPVDERFQGRECRPPVVVS